MSTLLRPFTPIFACAALAGVILPQAACGDPPCTDTATCEPPANGGGGTTDTGGTTTTGGEGGSAGSLPAGGGGSGAGAPNGSDCGDNGGCLSGFCADSRCCDTSCDGVCESCSLPGFQGTCTLHDAGTDPDAECGAGVCNGNLCATGDHAWSQAYGDGDPEMVTTMAWDGSNVVIAGMFRGVLNLGDGAMSANGSTEHMFVAKFDSAGVLQWKQHFQCPDGIAHAIDMDVDSSGSIVVTGEHNCNLQVGTTIHPHPSPSSIASRQAVVVRLNAAGNILWSKSFGSNEAIRLNVGVAPTGEVYLGGTYKGSPSLGGANLPSSSSYGIAIAKLESNGTTAWSFGYPNSAPYDAISLPENGFPVVADGSGNVTFMGNQSASVNFGGGALTNGPFAVRLDPSGNHTWSRELSCTPVDAAIRSDSSSVAACASQLLFLDPTGQQTDALSMSSATIYAIDALTNDDVAVTGTFSSDIDLGGGTIMHQGGGDFFAARFTSTNTHLWSHGYGSSASNCGTGTQMKCDLAVAVGDGVYLSGGFQGNMSFGGPVLPPNGTSQIFLAKLEP